MAAVHSPEPQRQPVESLSSLEDDPGEMAEKEGCTPSPPCSVVDHDESRNNNESNSESKVSGDDVAGLRGSPTEISIAHQTNNATVVPDLVIDLTASETEAHTHPVVSYDNQREFEWSEAEEESELLGDAVENDENNGQ